MAEPIQFPQVNHELKKPETMTDEQCSSLPICATNDQDGFPLLISRWKLTPEELEEINRTGSVYLGVVSGSHPPVWITPLNPFSE